MRAMTSGKIGCFSGSPLNPDTLALAPNANSLPMRGGPGPFSYIDMGGMFTVLKVRDNPADAPNAWYRHPAGTVAGPADAARMATDGIDPAAPSRR